MKKVLLILLFVSFLKIELSAQPKFEFRAVWVATVSNIDWPSKSGLSAEEQKKEVISILEMHKELGMNTIILQVRPAADALYSSSLEPWSRYLTGKQGNAPQPFYDPLEFWINECHKRGMELHTWLNPYRVAQSIKEELSVNHIAFQHPEWIIAYGNKLYFDPGIPETRTFITNVVKDIVQRYDVDAIHMDDYFYPYPTNEPFPDTASFRLYNRGFLPENLADWRRENVDITIEMIGDTIKAIKPWVKFGISPFGVWRNIADDPTGSDTRAGATNYDDLYANIIKWQEKGWIDYCLPQLYWYIGQPAADFKVLVNWWKNHSYERSMYIGMAPYRIEANSQTPEWRDPAQIPNQINLIRSTPEIEGEAFYSSIHFKRDLLGFQDSLKTNFYQKPAIIPPMPWINRTPPAPILKLKKQGRKIKWETETGSDVAQVPWQFVVYLNEEDVDFDPNSGKDIFVIQKENEIKFDLINRKKKKYQVRVSVLNRMNNESLISIPVKMKL